MVDMMDTKLVDLKGHCLDLHSAGLMVAWMAVWMVGLWDHMTAALMAEPMVEPMAVH